MRISVGWYFFFSLLFLLSSTSVSASKDDVLIVNGVRYEMVSIPDGVFMMGSESGESNEKPVHQVKVSAFQMGKTEVTQGLWKAVIGNNPSNFQKGENYPVAQVSWVDCQVFIQKLNRMTGGNYRLPTEAEWEYSCRAGTNGNYYGSIDGIAWYYNNSGGSAHPVGQKKTNAFGLYDMLGNVFEWCQDWTESYSSANQANPTGPSSGSFRVFRGGSWDTGVKGFSSSFRRSDVPGAIFNAVGFRLAKNNLTIMH